MIMMLGYLLWYLWYLCLPDSTWFNYRIWCLRLTFADHTCIVWVSPCCQARSRCPPVMIKSRLSRAFGGLAWRGNKHGWGMPSQFVGHVSCPRETHWFHLISIFVGLLELLLCQIIKVSGMPILRDFDSHERNVEGANGLCENHFPWPWLSKARTHSHFPAWLQEPVYSNGMLDESSGATQGKQIQGQRKPSFCHLQPQTSRALPGRTQPRLIVVNYSGILDTVPCHKGSTSRVGAPALSPLAPDVMAGRHSKPSSPTSVSTKHCWG